MNAKATAVTTDAWYANPVATPLTDRSGQTDDQRIKDITVLPPPEHLIRFFPIKGTAVETLIDGTRGRIHDIMAGTDDRLLVVIGPCSIHDPAAALDYAQRLKVQRDKYAGTLEIVMRVYFEKPRTTVGWKGLINDPYLDETFCIDEGLRMARRHGRSGRALNEGYGGRRSVRFVHCRRAGAGRSARRMGRCRGTARSVAGGAGGDRLAASAGAGVATTAGPAGGDSPRQRRYPAAEAGGRRV